MVLNKKEYGYDSQINMCIQTLLRKIGGSYPSFYITVFDCKRIPGRDIGEWIEKYHITNVKNPGIHLTLPGYEDGNTWDF